MSLYPKWLLLLSGLNLLSLLLAVFFLFGGLTYPGMTIVCGDSHTSTLGAVGAIAFGIGTNEVEHDGHLYYGFGASTDIIAASVEAYLDCINKFRK